MHRAIPTGAHDLRDPARVVAVGLVRHRAHRRLGLARLDADRRNPSFRHARMQPRRQRARLKADPFHLHPARPEERDQHLGLACHARLAHDATRVIDDADHPPDPIMRPPRADREEKRVTQGNGVRHKKEEQLDPYKPNQRGL
jgi:hypothetical protein